MSCSGTLWLRPRFSCHPIQLGCVLCSKERLLCTTVADYLLSDKLGRSTVGLKFTL